MLMAENSPVCIPADLSNSVQPLTFRRLVVPTTISMVGMKSLRLLCLRRTRPLQLTGQPLPTTSLTRVWMVRPIVTRRHTPLRRQLLLLPIRVHARAMLSPAGHVAATQSRKSHLAQPETRPLQPTGQPLPTTSLTRVWMVRPIVTRRHTPLRRQLLLLPIRVHARAMLSPAGHVAATQSRRLYLAQPETKLLLRIGSK